MNTILFVKYFFISQYVKGKKISNTPSRSKMNHQGSRKDPEHKNENE